MREYILAAAATLALSPIAAAGETPQREAHAVKALIENAVGSTLDILKDRSNDRETRRRKIYAVIDPVVDFSLMGKLTLGRAHWSQFDEAQKKEFIRSFDRVIRDSVFDKVEVYTNESAEFDEPVAKDKGKYELMMHVVSKGKRFKALFKVYHAGAAWKVYDLELEGISMVRVYAAQYDQVLQKSTPNDLLAKLKGKALATPDQFKTAGRSQTDRKK